MGRVTIDEEQLRDLLQIKRKWMIFVYLMYQLMDWTDDDYRNTSTRDELRLWGIDFDECSGDWLREQLEKLTKSEE